MGVDDGAEAAVAPAEEEEEEMDDSVGVVRGMMLLVGGYVG